MSCAAGSSESDRLGDEEEGSDCMDWERCLLRVFVVSCVISEGEDDGDEGVSIALRKMLERKQWQPKMDVILDEAGDARAFDRGNTFH